MKSQYFCNRLKIILINSDSCKVTINTMCCTIALLIRYLILLQTLLNQPQSNNTKYLIPLLNLMVLQPLKFYCKMS